jgi:uncharacterized protein (TIGR00297 family)
MGIQLLMGVVLGILIGLVAWRLQALSASGAVSAALTGGLIFGLGGWPWAALLLTFFVSSSLLSLAFSKRKLVYAEKFSKGSRRDWGQVMANGGLGALLVVALALRPGSSWPWFAYAGAIAAVNADTWATEIGVLYPRPPRLITTGRKVDSGTSGGVSLLGLLASLVGAATIGLIGVFVDGQSWDINLLLAATLGGTCGSLFDSFLGATLQAIYHCPQCDKETERYPYHLCGTRTQQVRGLSWLRNDGVNFLASVLGGLVALGVWLWL